ncbi:unnamed protein product [Rhizophagus irregularis]|nr:unnamed protein product [Rhizophagus irregularis]
MDNHIWNHIALNRWEVYSIVEQEARRSELNADDLVETTWRFKFNSYPIPHVGSPNFHRNGVYTFSGVMDGQLPWTLQRKVELE